MRKLLNTDPSPSYSKKKRLTQLRLVPDITFSQTLDALDAVSDLAPKLPPEIVKRFLNLLSTFAKALNLYVALTGKLDSLATTTAHKASIGFKLSDAHWRFVAALRTRDVETLIKYVIDNA
jgi:hypothetical protein